MSDDPAPAPGQEANSTRESESSRLLGGYILHELRAAIAYQGLGGEILALLQTEALRD